MADDLSAAEETLIEEFVDSLTPGSIKSMAVPQDSLDLTFAQLREAARALLIKHTAGAAAGDQARAKVASARPNRTTQPNE